MSSFDSQWDGRILGERYQIEALLGRGGMSSVYRAHDPNLQRKVAIKIIHPHLTDNPQFIKRFEQEAAAVAQLRHHNIVQVYDFNLDDAIYYMVMEYILGEPLSKKLRDLSIAGVRLPLDDIVRILKQICEAADYAHRRHMVHRDIKPANILINEREEAILMDFGIAKIVGGQSHTTTGVAMGTAAYLSPEQVRDEATDHRADIYALGITLFEMLLGEPPFQGDSTFQMMLKHVNEPIPDIREFDPSVPNAIVSILERALQKDPEARYQSAAEMAAALEMVSAQDEVGFVTNIVKDGFGGRARLLWQQANVQYDAKQYAAAVDRLDELCASDPNFQKTQVKQLRQQALDRLIEQATRLYRENHFQQASEILTAYHQRSPNDPEAANLEKRIEHGFINREKIQKLEALYDDATLLVEARRYEEALKKWQAIQQSKGPLPFDDRLGIAARAREGVSVSLYSEALRAIADRDPNQAALLLTQTYQVDPDFPDAHNVAVSIQRLKSRQKQRQIVARVGGGAVVGLALLLISFWLFRQAHDATQNGIGRETAAQGVIFVPGPATTVLSTSLAIQQTPTALPLALLATPKATHTATSAPTTTTVATMTSTSAPTFEPSPTQQVAVVTQPASLFAAPSADAIEKAIQRAGDELTVLGKSRQETWLYVQNGDGELGFVFAPLVAWQGEMDTLPIFESEQAVVTPTRESAATPLELDIFPLDETAECENDRWHVMIFFEGRGGNGVYSYYWDNELVAAELLGSITIQAYSPGGSIIGEGRVVSGDGQHTARELFVTPPACFGG